MASKPTHIEVKSKRSYRKRVAVKHPKPEAMAQGLPTVKQAAEGLTHAANVLNGVQKKNSVPQVQPAFATEDKAPSKRPLGRPRNEVGALTEANAKLQREVDRLKKELREESHAREMAQQDASDYKTFIKRVRKTVAGRYLVHRVKRQMPWVGL